MLLWLAILGCVAAARFAVRQMSSGTARELVFVAANLAAMFLVFFAPIVSLSIRYGVPLLYLALLSLNYPLIRRFAQPRARFFWLSFVGPLVLLASLRYIPWNSFALRLHLAWANDISFGAAFVGLSYLAFRLARLAVDIRNETAPTPGFLRYLGFCFFAPVMSVGPIHSYVEHRKALEERSFHPDVSVCLLRVLVGLAKFRFLAPLCDQFAFSNFILDGRFHLWWEVALASVAYYLFLYLNFSGVCDIAIGVAGWIGIHVPENFAHPFTARNIREFWNRWHITLYAFLRDMVFSPLSKSLISRWGVQRMDLALVASMMIVFLLAGLWHGNGWNFAIFGLLHGAAAVAGHYYTLFLKKTLSREQFKAYQASRLVHAAAIVVTFAYVAFTMLVFANPWPELVCVFRSIR